MSYVCGDSISVPWIAQFVRREMHIRKWNEKTNMTSSKRNRVPEKWQQTLIHTGSAARLCGLGIVFRRWVSHLIVIKCTAIWDVNQSPQKKMGKSESVHCMYHQQESRSQAVRMMLLPWVDPWNPQRCSRGSSFCVCHKSSLNFLTQLISQFFPSRKHPIIEPSVIQNEVSRGYSLLFVVAGSV